jgi:hypothetical protein
VPERLEKEELESLELDRRRGAKLAQPDGKTSNYKWNGGGVWSSLAYGFEGVPGLSSNSQLIFHVRYRDNEMVPDPKVPKTFFSQDSLYLGSRLRIGTANSTGSSEGVFVRSRKNDLAFENSSAGSTAHCYDKSARHRHPATFSYN